MLDESRSKQPQREDPLGITKEQWMSMLEDPDLITEKDITLLKLILEEVTIIKCQQIYLNLPDKDSSLPR